MCITTHIYRSSSDSEDEYTFLRFAEARTLSSQAKIPPRRVPSTTASSAVAPAVVTPSTSIAPQWLRSNTAIQQTSNTNDAGQHNKNANDDGAANDVRAVHAPTAARPHKLAYISPHTFASDDLDHSPGKDAGHVVSATFDQLRDKDAPDMRAHLPDGLAAAADGPYTMSADSGIFDQHIGTPQQDRRPRVLHIQSQGLALSDSPKASGTFDQVGASPQRDRRPRVLHMQAGARGASESSRGAAYSPAGSSAADSRASQQRASVGATAETGGTKSPTVLRKLLGELYHAADGTVSAMPEASAPMAGPGQLGMVPDQNAQTGVENHAGASGVLRQSRAHGSTLDGNVAVYAHDDVQVVHSVVPTSTASEQMGALEFGVQGTSGHLLHERGAYGGHAHGHGVSDQSTRSDRNYDIHNYEGSSSHDAPSGPDHCHQSTLSHNTEPSPHSPQTNAQAPLYSSTPPANSATSSVQQPQNERGRSSTGAGTGDACSTNSRGANGRHESAPDTTLKAGASNLTLQTSPHVGADVFANGQSNGGFHYGGDGHVHEARSGYTAVPYSPAGDLMHRRGRTYSDGIHTYMHASDGSAPPAATCVAYAV
jgi:hypothetical protein